MRRQFLPALLLACCCSSVFLSSSTVQVKYKEGVTHGFLVMTTLDGTAIAVGDSTEVVHGNDVTNHLTHHFKDGSLQQEDFVFSQRGTFRLITYRRIQKGPSFKNASDLASMSGAVRST